jgi:hypothetical protein
MPELRTLLPYAFLLLSLGTVAFTLIYVGTSGSRPDSKKNTISQIQTLGIVNFLMIFAFAIMASYYVEAVPSMREPYTLFMAHGAVFLGLMAVSIATLNQLA